jgi:tetratricopeptide (TPR) repeat protein
MGEAKGLYDRYRRKASLARLITLVLTVFAIFVAFLYLYHLRQQNVEIQRAYGELSQKNAALQTANAQLASAHNANNYIVQGLRYQNLGDSDAALKAYDNASMYTPAITLALTLEGNLELQNGDKFKGLQILEQAASHDPEDALAQISLAKANAENGLPMLGKQHLEKAIQLNPRLAQKVQSDSVLRNLLVYEPPTHHGPA